MNTERIAEGKSPIITMRLSTKSDEKMLAKFFCDCLINQQENPDRIANKLLKFSFNFSLVRNKILQKYPKELSRYWDELLFWIVLADEKAIGFSLISWNEREEKSSRKATIHEIYLLSEFRKKKIEDHIVTGILDFCNENNLRLSFPVNPGWQLFEEENL